MVSRDQRNGVGVSRKTIPPEATSANRLPACNPIFKRPAMYICICHSVRESAIREAAAGGVCKFRELSTALGVGQDCGKCIPAAKKLLEHLKADDPELQPGSAADR